MKRSRRVSKPLVGIALAWLLVSPARAQEPAEELTLETLGAETIFSDEILVQLVTLQVRAVDFSGAPLLGLGPEDFEVRLGRTELAVEAVDWIPPGPSLRYLETQSGGGETPLAVDQPRLVVLFVQSSAVPHRVVGLQWARRRLGTLLESLHPSDRVAVVEHRYHLELRSDFTLDRGQTEAAVDDAVMLRPARLLEGDGEPVLAGRFDLEGAAEAGFVEEGLQIVAEALDGLPGEKQILFLGWGLGSEHGGIPTPRFRSAVLALHQAGVTVSSLAVGGLMYNRGSSLDGTLEMIASATGGTFASSNPFFDLALRRIAHSFSGHYVLTFAISPGDGDGKVHIKLRRGSTPVHHKPMILRWEPRSSDRLR